MKLLHTILMFSIVTITRGSRFNLTVGDGLTLEGPQCPGVVTIFCMGSDIVSLRWRYNDNITILSYFSDGRSTTQANEAAFFGVRLLSVTQNPSNPNLANFLSSLTVNYLELQSNNIFDISCGTPGVSEVMLMVNLSIIQPGPPNSPVITMVTAAYQSGELNSIEVEWDKPNNFCPTTVYGLSVDYEVNITDHDSARANQSSCEEMLCAASFKNFTSQTAEKYEISIQAENELGISDVLVYPITIAHQIQLYFEFKVFERENQIIGQCAATAELIGATECHIQYIIVSLTRNISRQVTVLPNKEFSVDDAPLSGATYYFQFSVLVNFTLRITGDEVFEFSAPKQGDSGVPEWGVIIIVMVLLGALVLVISIFLVLGLYFNKNPKQKDKYANPEELESEPERDPGPPQYEIHVEPYNYILPNGREDYPTYKIKIKFQNEAEVVFKSYDNFKYLRKYLCEEYLNGRQLKPLPSQDLPVNSEGKRKDIPKQRAGLYKFVLSVLTVFPNNSAVERFFEDCHSVYYAAIQQNAILKEE